MPGAARLSRDHASCNGKIVTGACSVMINNQPAARIGDTCIPHVPYKGPHKRCNPIATGCSSVIVEGKPLARKGSIVRCGCPVMIGSCDVNVGG